MPTRLKIDADNRPVITQSGLGNLKKLILNGTWSLTKDNDLVYRINASEASYYGKKLIFQGGITGVKGDSLFFRAEGREPLSGIRGATLELKGKWRADKNNRICFDVARSRGSYDRLTLQGAWEIGEHNELSYRYARTRLAKRTKEDRVLAFKGRWTVASRYIEYELEGGSTLSFSAGLSSAQTAPNYIKYLVGIKYDRGEGIEKQERPVTIYGKWRPLKDLAVAFEAEYRGGKRVVSEFGIEKVSRSGSSITLFLKDKKGLPLGYGIKFSKSFGADAELFLELSRLADETRAIGGVRIRF